MNYIHSMLKLILSEIFLLSYASLGLYFQIIFILKMKYLW